MLFKCKDINDEGYAETTTLKTLKRYTGFNDEHIDKLLSKSDKIVFDGYVFELIQEDLKKKKRTPISQQRLNELNDNFINNELTNKVFVEGEKQSKTQVYMNNVPVSCRDFSKITKIHGDRFMRVSKKLKSFSYMGFDIELRPMVQKYKIYQLIEKDKVVLEGSAKELAEFLGVCHNHIYGIVKNKTLSNKKYRIIKKEE